jgi:hypothetical protein
MANFNPLPAAPRIFAVYAQWGPRPAVAAFEVEAEDHAHAMRQVVDSFEANRIVRIMAVERAK